MTQLFIYMEYFIIVSTITVNINNGNQKKHLIMEFQGLFKPTESKYLQLH